MGGGKWRHTIGIVGGMGPFAHQELEKQLLVATRKRLGRAPKDQDFPEWIASSILGCTEIPLALGREPIDGTHLLDPLEVIAEASVAIAAGDRSLPPL